MRATILVNSSAGAVSSGTITSAGIAEAFRAAGVDATVESVAGGAMAEQARAALQSGVDAVVAGGGDGSIRCVAAVLAGTRTPLGVLPLGTLNHFARDLGIPTDLEGAARAIAAGRVRALDIGEVNGQIFVNTSCLGFYPPVVRERDRQRAHLGRGKWLAAVSALLTVLPRAHALRLSIGVDGQTLRRTTRFVFVGNNEYRMHLFTQGERKIFDSGDPLSLHRQPAQPPVVVAARSLGAGEGRRHRGELRVLPRPRLQHRGTPEATAADPRLPRRRGGPPRSAAALPGAPARPPGARAACRG